MDFSKVILNDLRSANIIIIVLAALVLLPHGSYSDDIFNAGITFDIVTPKNEFKDNLNRNGYGGSLMAVFKPNPLVPLKVGLELGLANYGMETRREPFSYSIPDVTVNVRRSNNIFRGHLLLRAQKEYGNWSPYADGLFGMTYLWTKTTIEDELDMMEIASSENIDDVTMSYGYGGGVMYKVWGAGNGINDIGSIYIDFKVRYLYGGKAEYLKKGAISVGEGGQVSYDVSESRTDMMLYQIGVAVGF